MRFDPGWAVEGWAPTSDQSVDYRKGSKEAFFERLRHGEWITVPAASLIADRGRTLALFPIDPQVEWRWEMHNGQAYSSGPLVWLMPLDRFGIPVKQPQSLI